MKIELINNASADWHVLKVDGKEFTCGHRINNHQWIGLIKNCFNIEVECKEISDEDMEEGKY